MPNNSDNLKSSRDVSISDTPDSSRLNEHLSTEHKKTSTHASLNSPPLPINTPSPVNEKNSSNNISRGENEDDNQHLDNIRIDSVVVKDSLDKSLRLNPRGTEGLIFYSYVSPNSLSFFDNGVENIVDSNETDRGNDNEDNEERAPSAKGSFSLSYPYIYTSEFVMQCLANQVAQAQPEPKIAIATSDPETLEEEEIPYVTPETVMPPLKDDANPKAKSTTANDVSTDTDHVVDNDRLLRNSTPAGIDQTQDYLKTGTADTKTDNTNSESNNTNSSENKEKRPPRESTDFESDKPKEEKTSYDDLVKEKRPKNEEEIQAEKESKLESYKQFVAKQKSKIDIDYPAIRVSIEANALPSRMYFIMNALSAVIASYGLVMDSAAVVIGAMLVAMMLGPISGTALAIIDYRIPLLRKSILTVVAGATMVLFIGYVIGSIHDGQPLTNEILSRTQPTSMDLMVALAGGTAGAYAMISPHLSVAVVGVAVATALVPPLAASGILFSNGEMSLGFGALLLALTNIIAIQFTNGLVLWFAGFRRLMSEDYEKGTHFAFFRRNAVPLILLTGIGIYLSYNLNNVSARQKFENEVEQVVGDYFIEKDNMLGATQFINKDDHLTIRAVVTGETRPNSSDVRYLENKLTANLKQNTPDLPDIQLQLRYIPVVVIESKPRTTDAFGKTDAAILSNE